MADLKALEQEIADLGNQIRTLKASDPSTTGSAPSGRVTELVGLLLEKKTMYAESNGGIGIDGKPLGGTGGGAGGGGGGGGKKANDDEAKGPAKQVRRVVGQRRMSSLSAWNDYDL
jgi:hypothetical protein